MIVHIVVERGVQGTYIMGVFDTFGKAQKAKEQYRFLNPELAYLIKTERVY
jgi:hypothetical protein